MNLLVELILQNGRKKYNTFFISFRKHYAVKGIFI